MTEKELEERIEKCLQNEATKAIWRKDFESDEFKLADGLNRELFGESLEKKPRCACLENFYFSLRFRNPVKTFKYMTAKRFKVKPGVVLQSFALAEPLTPQSSDEDWRKLLRSNPNAIRLFESFPENWKELIEAEVEEGPAATEPAATEPAATEPAATEPAATEPAATEPAATEPAATEPAATEPAATEPAATEPAATEPAATEPAATEPNDEEGAMPDFANMTEPEPRKYAGDNGISLKGKTGRKQIADILTANFNDI